MKYQNSRDAFLAESEYVGQAFDIVSAIRVSTVKYALQLKGQELMSVIQNALRAHTPNRDLITIEQMLAQGMALCEFADQQSGGRDVLLLDRKQILQNAYEYLDASF